MPGTPGGGASASAQPVRVEYVPKSQRKAQQGAAPAPKPPPPRVEPMPDSLAGEFADFDDGPAKVTEVVEATVVGEAAGTGGAGNRKKGNKKVKAKGSRKRKNKA